MRDGVVDLLSGQISAIVWISYARELLERLVKFVISAFKRTERISQPGLSNELERSLAHPLNDVDFLRTIRHHGLEFFLKLPAMSLKYGTAGYAVGTIPVVRLHKKWGSYIAYGWC